MTIKAEVNQNILNSINSLALIMDTPNLLAPKGTLTDEQEFIKNVMTYDSALMPKPPELIECNKYLDSLVNAYKELNQ